MKLPSLWRRKNRLVNHDALATSIALRRELLKRGNGVLDDEGLGIYGKRYLANFAGVLPCHDFQGSLDALGLYRYPETRGTAAHLH
jgi:hypothetical protein